MRFVLYALSALLTLVAASASEVNIVERAADPAPAAAADANVYASRQLTRSRLIQNLKDREAHQEISRAGTALEARASGSRSYPACYPTDSEGVKFDKGFARYTGWDIPAYDHIDISTQHEFNEKTCQTSCKTDPNCAGLFFWTDIENSGYCSKKNVTHKYVASDFNNTDYSASLPGAVVDLRGKCKEWHGVVPAAMDAVCCNT